MRPFALDGADIHDWDAVKAMVLQLDPDDPEAEQAARYAIERRATNGVGRALAEQRKRIVDSVANLDADDFVAWAAEDLEQAIGRARRDYELYDEIRRALMISADLGVRVAVRQLDSIGFGFDWTLANAAAAEWADRYTGELVANITETTRGRVRAAVQEWVRNGLPLEALEEELTPLFGRQRAELIASTEVTRSYAEANRQAYQQSGVAAQVEWRTAADERVCPVCGPLDGTRAPTTGSGFGTVGYPPAHPRCRCWIVPVVEA